MARKKNSDAQNQEIKETILVNGIENSESGENFDGNLGDDEEMTVEYAEAGQDDSDDLDKNDEFMRTKCKIIGANVRFQRKKRKFSIDNLADCIKLSASYVGLLERGDRCPSLKCLLKLCELFDVTPDELLLDKSDKKQPMKLSEAKQKDPYSAVLSLLHGLTDEELEYTANHLKGLRKLSKKNDGTEEPVATTYTRKKKQ